MDPLTHALTGVALADALSMPGRGRGRLFFAMGVAAAPDLDLLPAFIAKLPGNLRPGAVVFGLAAGGIHGRICGGKGSAVIWSGFAVLALLSHAALDLANGGVMFWWPFSAAWVAVADLPVVDVFTLVPLFVSFLANHPPAELWRRRWREGTLERSWRRFSENMRERYKPAAIARWCLLIVAIAFTLRLVLV